MEPFEKIDAKDIELSSKDVKKFIVQMVKFHASRIDKEKLNSSLDIVNDFLRIMKPLRDDVDYWIDFFEREKKKLQDIYDKVNNVEGSQVSFFDEENSL